MIWLHIRASLHAFLSPTRSPAFVSPGLREPVASRDPGLYPRLVSLRTPQAFFEKSLAPYASELPLRFISSAW